MGLNLHSVVAPAIGAVNSNLIITLKQYTGTVQAPDFSQTPSYSSHSMSAQIQGLQSDDIRLLNGLNIQGVRRKIYLWGTTSGIIRSLQKGNDLVILPDNSEWKCAYVFEDFGHNLTGSLGWCSIAVVLQNPTSEG